MKWLAWLHIAEKLAPVVLGTVPGIPDGLRPKLASAIAEAQQIEGASGADKKAHVLAAIGDVEPDVAPVVEQGIDTTVGVINLIHEAHGGQLQAQLAAPPAAAVV